MDDALRSRLHDLALYARRLLTTETHSILTAVYGLSADGRFEAVANLPAVQSVPEAAETRKRLELYMRDEAAAGLKGSEAVDRLIRETAFTHLNRLVAFKLLEARKIIRGTIDRHHSSNHFLFYVNDHAEDEARYQAGDMPKDALEEGPRDIAYRHFLLWQAAQLAREVPVLFDAANLPSRLFPRPRVLRELLDALNASELRDAWSAENDEKTGNEETLGWVYQYFNEQEKDAVFERLNKQKQKIRREDLPAATQLFTPRWIVRFLIENTLGRHWVQMHPDSRLATELKYLVPLAGEVPAEPLKPVRELTLLDPACGTMHFGLVAFDLFATMYREELERAGEPGWPELPSVNSSDEIPAAILANNLFGIDIDLRAVQLAALSLYVRAKAITPKATVTPQNLVCADVTVLDGNRLGAFVAALGHKQPIVESAIRALWPRLKQAGEFGSLLRLEDDLRSMFTPSRTSKPVRGIQTLPGLENVEAGSFAAFNELDAQVREALNEFARQEAARGDDATSFVAGTEQGLKLLDLLARRYDVVTANPPYMSIRGMPATLADFLKLAYPEGKGDLYAAFILRCAELLAEGGRMGMITQQSFMFISSYEKLREKLRGGYAVETMAHTGPRAFAEISGEKVNTTLFALRRDASESHREKSVGTYFRLVREPDAEAKRVYFERSVEALQSGADDPLVYQHCQSDFDAILSGPWAYWIPHSVSQLFLELPKLSSIAILKHGMATGDNFRFLRFWWEVGSSHTKINTPTRNQAVNDVARWYPCMKGGTYRRWWGNQEYLVNYLRGGKELIASRDDGSAPGHRHDGAEYYFRQGITYSHLASGPISFRYMPQGFVFEQAGSCLFVDDIATVLGICNSRFALFAKKLINPTINFQVGSLGRLPIPTSTSDSFRDLVNYAIALAKEDSIESEITYDFVAPPSWPNGLRDFTARHAKLVQVEQEIDEEAYRLYGIELESNERRVIEAELADSTTLADDAEDGEHLPSDEEEEPSESLLTREGLAQRWLNYAIGIALGRFQPGVEGAIGCGRSAPEVSRQLRGLADEDGIGLIAPGHVDDLCDRIERALELMVGENEAHTLIDAATGGKSLAEYLTSDFYKAHMSKQQYRKRPVYWLLQSPKRKYSLLLFHERLTGDSLSLILGNRYLQGRINTLRESLAEAQTKVSEAAPGRARREAERRRDDIADLRTDAEEFAHLIRAVLERTNERGEIVGWRPEIDDGVLINLAPLHTLMPAWAAEPRKCWQALERGDYDWSHTAMRYWPDRVLAKCRTNKSYAIAHGVATE